MKLIWYWEKRQDDGYIVMQELQNLEWISENISQAIIKAENDWNIKVDDIIINIPTPNLFCEFSKINHIREKSTKKIDTKELYKLLEIVESRAIKKHYKSIKSHSWYKKSDLKLLISNLTNILIDNKKTKKLIGETPEEVNISLLNIFIPDSKYETIKYIEKSIKKNIINIIPSEFAITSLLEKIENLVIIDLWNSHISITVKKHNNIIWIKKLSFWINDLIKQIRQNYNLTKNDIIKKIEDNIFLPEKLKFLTIFKDILTITLEEILWKKVCPNEFFMLGWWANKFIKIYLSRLDFHDSNLKMVGNITFIKPNIDILDFNTQDNPEWIDNAKSNINIFAMIKTTLDFIKKDKNKIEKILKQVVKDLDQ